MTYGPDPGRGRVDLAGIGLCIVDEGRNRFGWKRWIGQHGLRLPSDTRHGRDVADEIEIELSVECGVDCVSRTDQKERIAVRGRVNDELVGDIGGRAGPVLDDEWLAKTRRQPLSYQPSDDVVSAPSGEANDNTHRPRWIGLCPSDARHGRQRGSARCQMQKSATGKFHSITSSAWESSVGGTEMRSAFAVIRLIVRSNLVGCSTGKSAGFAPRSTLST